MQRLSVLFPTPLPCYDYTSQHALSPGQLVKAPWGRKQVTGIVWDTPPDLSISENRLKAVVPYDAGLCLPQESVRFINWVSGYTLTPTGMVLKMALIPHFEKQSSKPLTFSPPEPRFHTLSFSDEQKQAILLLKEQLKKGFSVSLLDGVTGSGKTEVYFEMMAEILETTPHQILVLLPEIILTTAWLERFEKRFGTRPALWHSALTPKQRRDTWQAVLNGTARVIVGARSALFLPFQKLSLIIVDEEHDSSFKQEEGILYHARDMAIVRAKIAKCPIVLSSATPSIETYSNVLAGRYAHISLPNRYHNAVFPEVHIIDMRYKGHSAARFISEKLASEIEVRLQKKEQSLLFLNRRGYAPLVLCHACGNRLQCPHCSAWLVEHKQKACLMCHHCGWTISKPKTCPVCQETNTFISCGPGVERIYEEVSALFPTAKICQLTSDTLSHPKEFETICRDIEVGALDILIGTQILAKGHNFNQLTLVGVIDADMGLSGGDLRAGERTFQLLHQVMGRAGRAQKKGMAFLQSYDPDNLIIRALKENNRSRFLTEEMATRKILGMPPYGKLAAVILSGPDKERTERYALDFVKAAPIIENIEILGPVAAPLALLKNKYRFRLLVKTNKETHLQPFLRHWMSRCPAPKNITVRLDIDPYSFF